MGKYKVWFTQGQGCGEKPDAECDTLDEALDEAASMWGEGSVGIELPDGSWYSFGDDWKVSAKVTLLRMCREATTPKQKWLRQRWHDSGVPGRTLFRRLQSGAHTFRSVLCALQDMYKRQEAQDLFCASLAWGMFDVFECPVGTMPTDEQIDWLVKGKGE